MTEGDKKEMDQHYLDAGWHPPVKTRLRVVQNGCYRSLTPAEANEVAETLWDMIVKENAEVGVNGPWHLTLASGATIILVGGNDAT
jgi:hypothetical protein